MPIKLMLVILIAALRLRGAPISRLAMILALLPGASPSCADELLKFIWLHQCPIIERMEIIAMTSQREKERFIVVALEGWPQRYVQCLFLDKDTTFLCEASSGFYGPAKGEPGHLDLPVWARVELADLGFETEVEEGNYWLQFELTGLGRFDELSGLMLSALFRSYGAWSGSALDIYAPLAPELAPETTQCAPVG